MNVQIIYDGTDVTNYVTEYSRQQGICNGIGNATFTMSYTVGITPVTYKEFVLYEDSIKKGTYVVTDYTYNAPAGVIQFGCQDYSKRLQDYFIADTYLVTTPTTSKFIIQKYMDEASVSYNFTTGGSGTLVNNQSTFGLTDALSTIQQMTQMNGWYMYFNPNNVAQIGRFNFDSAVTDLSVNKSEVIEYKTSRMDTMFRNRAVVYGMGDPVDGGWIHGEVDQHGRYDDEHDGNDIRSIVVSNPYIPDAPTALYLANEAVKEFTKPTFEVSVDLIGAFDVTLGKQVYVDTPTMQFKGAVTSVGSSLSRDGLITHLVLNQRCPRLFGYYDYGAYVYVGTDGAGVWRKPILGSDEWSNFSEGLTDLHIVDLSVANSSLACVTEDGTMYTRHPSYLAWLPVTGFPTIDESTGLAVTGDGFFSSCVVDRYSSEAFGGYNIIPSGEPPYSWIVGKKGNSTLTSTNVMLASGVNRMGIHSIDSNGSALYATTITGPYNIFSHSMNRVTNWDNSYMQSQETTNHTGHININNSFVEPYILDGGQIYTYTFTEGDYIYSYYGTTIGGDDYSGIGKWNITTDELVDYLVQPEDPAGPDWVYVWMWYPYGTQSSPGVVWFSGSTALDTDFLDLAITKFDFNTHTMSRLTIFPFINDNYSVYQGHVICVEDKVFCFYSTLQYSGPPDWTTVNTEYRCAIIDIPSHTIDGDHLLGSGSGPDSDLTNNDFNQYITVVDDTVIGLFGYPDRWIPDPFNPPYNMQVSKWITFGISTDGSFNTSLLVELDTVWGDLIDSISSSNVKAILYPDYTNHCALMAYKYNAEEEDDSVEIRQINKNGTSYRKIGSSPLYVDPYPTYDPTDPRNGNWDFVAGKEGTYPVVEWQGGMDVYDRYGIFYLYRCDDDFYFSPVMEDDTGCVIYISNRTDGQFISRAYLDYPLNSRHDIIDITEWSYSNGYNSLYPMGDKIMFVGRYVYASLMPKLLEYKDASFRHVANVHDNNRVDTSYVPIISVYGGDPDINSEDLFMYDESFVAPLVVIASGTTMSVRGFIDSQDTGNIVSREIFSNQGSNTIKQIVNPIAYSTPTVYATFAGEVGQLETTNHQILPYIFASVVTDRNRFFQADGIITVLDSPGSFTDRTNNLPNVEITVIRADDSF